MFQVLFGDNGGGLLPWCRWRSWALVVGGLGPWWLVAVLSLGGWRSFACGDLVLLLCGRRGTGLWYKKQMWSFPPVHSSLTHNWAIGSDKLTKVCDLRIAKNVYFYFCKCYPMVISGNFWLGFSCVEDGHSGVFSSRSSVLILIVPVWHGGTRSSWSWMM